MNTKYIISLTSLIALTGASCWSAASTPSLETPIGSFARLYAEGPADLAPGILTSLYRKDLLQLAQIGRKEPQRFPMLYQDAMRELFNQKEKFRQFLKKYNGDVQNALLNAVTNNKPWAIDYLVQNGANVNEQNKHGWTPLMRAAQEGHEATVAQLIVAGADVDAKDCSGRTALMFAAMNGHKAVVIQLIAAKANANTRDSYGNTVLMEAARYGHEAVVAQLIAAGADIDARDANGETALNLTESFLSNDGYDQDKQDGAHAIVDDQQEAVNS